MKINELVKKAHDNAEQKRFFAMEDRLMRKMKQLDFDNEEIEFFTDMCMSARLMQVVSETGEVYQALREGNIDKASEEMGDILISTSSMAGRYDVPLEEATTYKLDRNEKRKDLHGKRF